MGLLPLMNQALGPFTDVKASLVCMAFLRPLRMQIKPNVIERVRHHAQQVFDDHKINIRT
jgi:hypothetical protein